MRVPRLYEQVDRTAGRLTYSWILDAPHSLRRALEPMQWRWIRGRPGCHVTNDPQAARHVAEAFGLRIETNGTHATHGAPVYQHDRS